MRADLRALAGAYRLVTAADDLEFAIIVPSGGKWIGRATTVEGKPVLAVRTYVDGELR